jgi:hypothetical protein
MITKELIEDAKAAGLLDSDGYIKPLWYDPWLEAIAKLVELQRQRERQAVPSGMVPADLVRQVFEHYPEWQDDLDETACQNGWATCPVCESCGCHDSRKKRPFKHLDGCKNEQLRAMLDANQQATIRSK